MTFICYVHSRDKSTPHMEALDSRSLSEAELQARRMLGEHRHSTHAEVFENDQPVATIQRDGPDPAMTP